VPLNPFGTITPAPAAINYIDNQSYSTTLGPTSIVTHGLGLNITVESYNGSLDFGLVACRKAVPDLPDLAGMLVAAHRELVARTVERAAAPTAPARATARKLPRRSAAKTTKIDGSRRKPVRGGQRRSSALAA